MANKRKDVPPRVGLAVLLALTARLNGPGGTRLRLTSAPCAFRWAPFAARTNPSPGMSIGCETQGPTFTIYMHF